MAPLRRSILLSTLACVTACATNPARHLTDNGVDVRVSTSPAGLFRGDEALDEQDFYELSGDTTSFEAVKASRAVGMPLQATGLSLAVIGAATLAFGLFNGLLADGGALGEKGLYREDFISPVLGWVLVGLGAAGLAGGSALFVYGRGKASGKPPVFDLAHAQAALENGRYGEGGLRPANVATLELKTATGQATYCGLSGALVLPLVARDDHGREVPIQDHLDWVELAADPADALSARDALVQRQASFDEEDLSADQTFAREADHKAPPKEYVLTSPLRRSLANYQQPVRVTVRVKDTDLTSSITLAPDLTCAEELGGRARAGDAGRSGSSGASGSSSRAAAAGSPGGAGRDGAAGAEIDAEAAWVRDPAGRRLALVAWSGPDGSDATLLDPQGSLALVATGGRGGAGGRGGRGGRGAHGGDTRCPADGAPGGAGGAGGRGGPGGRVRLELGDEALGALVSADAAGGAGGQGGAGGRGGDSGAFGSRCPRANSGPDGPRGQSGPAGSDGVVSKKVVSLAQLEQVQAALRTLPGFKLEGAIDAPIAAPRRGRR